MTRFIALVFCLTFLFLAGGWIKFGMVLSGAIAAMLVAYTAWLFMRMFLGSRR